MFSRKAVFEFDLPENITQEEIELELIEAGLEEIENVDGRIYVFTEIIQTSAHCRLFWKE